MNDNRQYDLDFEMRRAFARKCDPVTSHAAARSIDDAIPNLEAIVLRHIKNAGQHGMTIDELVAATGIDKVSISPRLKPLTNKKLIYAADVRKGKSGRSQTVWRGIN